MDARMDSWFDANIKLCREVTILKEEMQKFSAMERGIQDQRHEWYQWRVGGVVSFGEGDSSNSNPSSSKPT